MLRSTNDQIVPSRVSRELNWGEVGVDAFGILVLAIVPQKEIFLMHIHPKWLHSTKDASSIHKG